MQSIPPNGSPIPEIENVADTPLKKRRIDSSIDLILPEVFVLIAKYLNPKSIYCSLVKTNKFFFECSPLIFTHAYDKWWKKWMKKEFPHSYLALPKETRENQRTEWHQIYKKECLIRKNIIEGKYKIIYGKFVPELNALHQSENLFITHTGFSIDGWTLNADRVFSLSGAFTSCTTFKNMLFIFYGDNSIQALKVPSPLERCNQTLPLKSLEFFKEIQFLSNPPPANVVNPLPIQEAKVQWPYLFGFTKDNFSLWNMNEQPAKSITFTVTKLEFVGLWEKQIIYFKDENIFSQNIHSSEGISLFDLKNYHFNEIHMEGPRILCWISEEQNKRVKKLLLIDLLNGTQDLFPFQFKFDALTFIYNAHFYWCDATLRVLGSVSLDTLKKVSIFPLKKKVWESKKEITEEKNSGGLEFKLINGFVHTRVNVSNLANNMISQIGGTVCAHAHFALDYSKVVYLNGCLVRGYPCSDENNIEILDFNPEAPVLPPPLDPPVDGMDVS